MNMIETGIGIADLHHILSNKLKDTPFYNLSTEFLNYEYEHQYIQIDVSFKILTVKDGEFIWVESGFTDQVKYKGNFNLFYPIHPEEIYKKILLAYLSEEKRVVSNESR